MTAYIIRRLLLLIPTLFGILIINFVVIQFAPGGPVERIIQQYINPVISSSSGMGRLGGKSSTGMTSSGSGGSSYAGGEALDPAVIKEIEQRFGFDKPAHERFFKMVWDFIRFDFGKSYYRNEAVINIIFEKMPVSVTLGLWGIVIMYLVSIPLGIRKARKDGTRFDFWTSTFINIFYAIPPFLLAVFLIIMLAGGSYFNIFPIRGLVSSNWDELNWGAKILDYLWHITLPVICIAIAGFATLTLWTKNSFLDEMHKLYVMTARSKGLAEKKVLYGHVFRNAMLIIIAGLPGMLVAMFFTGNVLIEIIFNLDGLGLLGFQSILNRDYPVFFANLYIMTLLGLVIRIISDIMYTILDPRIDFETRDV
ncbi:MAG: microcin C ABC transporter permease YejB [Spirochaetes bacterium]|nr:microcin C ABC transporter permease YejB [Spirochaetota bacterium]